MIVYISIPYSLEHLSTQNTAITHLNRILAGFYKRNPTWAAVNALYTIYNNPNMLEDANSRQVTYKQLYGTVGLLMKSANAHVVIRVPGWEYSDIVMAECACAGQLGIMSLSEDVNQ